MAKNKDLKELTTFQQKQAKYWQDRAEQNYLAGEKDVLQVAKELKENYLLCFKEIEDKINSFYVKYSSKFGLTLDEAKSLLNRQELKDFKQYIDAMIKMGKKENFTELQLNQFEALKYKANISRLDALQTNIKYEILKLTNMNEDQIRQLLENEYEETYFKTIYDEEVVFGFDSTFSGLDKNKIHRAISTRYLGANYSQRIWTNQTILLNTLNQAIPKGLTLGYNPTKLARIINNKLNTNYNNIVRLVRTEYSKIMNDATLAGYKQTGVDSFKILTTLDSRTCDDCGAYEGKIIAISDAQTGINLPPFHPNCRCTTIPYFEEDEIDKMTDEELSKIGYITYDEWKDGLITLENGKVHYKNS